MQTEKEQWRREYQECRYLADLSEDEIRQRLNDLLDGAVIFTTAAWDARIEHIEEELRLRGDSLDHVRTIRARYRSARELLDADRASCAAAGFDPGTCLVKYGHYNHLSSTWENGLLLISPASGYSDPSLNSACRDEQETGFQIILPPGIDMSIRSEDEFLSINGIHRITWTYTRKDYFVFCCSSVFSCRLAAAFERDACLVVRDVPRFMGSLIENSPIEGGSVSSGGVTYIDPFDPGSRLKEARFPKHFRYAYQHEWRMVWTPRTEIDRLFSVFITPGDLKEYCDLYRFDGSDRFEKVAP